MRKMRFYLLFVLTAVITRESTAQSDPKPDRGNVNFHTGTILIYSTVSLGYEAFDLLKKSQRHSLRPLLRAGIWNANVFNRNTGVQCAAGFSYILGSGRHHFEHSSEFVSHFDRGLKGQAITYIAGTYRPFAGYRFDSKDQSFIFRIGIGWKEVVQLGLGYRL